MLTAKSAKASGYNKVKKAKMTPVTPQASTPAAPKISFVAASTYSTPTSTIVSTDAPTTLGFINFHEAFKLVENNGMEAVDLVADCACIFTAVSLHVSINEKSCQELKAATIKYIFDNAAEYKEISLRDSDKDLSFDEYLEKIALSYQIVGEHVLSAITNIMNKPVKV